MSEERARPIFVVCPTCDGVGFVLFESIAFAGIEEPDGIIRVKCDMCGGTGEIMDEPITIKVKASEWARVTRERDEAREALKRITESDMRWSKKIARDALEAAK